MYMYLLVGVQSLDTVHVSYVAGPLAMRTRSCAGLKINKEK